MLLNLFKRRRKSRDIVTTTQQQSNNPWAKQVPYLEEVFKKAQDLFKKKYEAYFPKPTVVPFSPETKMALEKKAKRALAGSELTKIAKSQVEQTAKGDFLEKNPTNLLFQSVAQGQYLGKNPSSKFVLNLANPNEKSKKTEGFQTLSKTAKGENNKNPALDELLKRTSEKLIKHYREHVFPKIDGKIIKYGRFGSKAHLKLRQQAEETLAESLKNLAIEIYYKDHQQERLNQLSSAAKIEELSLHKDQAHLSAAHLVSQNYMREKTEQLNAAAQLSAHYQQARSEQLHTMKMAPILAQQDYLDISHLNNVGSHREALAQTQLNDEVERWNANMTFEANKLAQYLGLIGGGYGGESLSSVTQPLYREQAESDHAMQSILLKGMFEMF